MPSRSSSSSPSSSASAAAARGRRPQHFLDIDPHRCRAAASRWSRLTARTCGPIGDIASVRRWISWRSEARACSSGRRLQSSSASLPRSTGRGALSARTASNARVFRPVGSTFSLVRVQASIWPIRRRRTRRARPARWPPADSPRAMWLPIIMRDYTPVSGVLASECNHDV